MNTKTEDRLLGLTVAALAATIGGELLGSQLLVTIGVAGFAVALVALFAVMTAVLALSVARSPELNAPDPTATDRVR